MQAEHDEPTKVFEIPLSDSEARVLMDFGACVGLGSPPLTIVDGLARARSIAQTQEQVALPFPTPPGTEVLQTGADRRNTWIQELPAIITAFTEIRDGYSVDRVIADPTYNSRFVHRCWQLGVPGTTFQLNWALMSARKHNCLAGFGRSRSQRFSRAHLDRFYFASEIAIRAVQDAHLRGSGRAPSVDTILCDPSLSSEFDSFAKRIAPGFTTFEYRWAALCGRKAALRVRIVHMPRIRFRSIGRADRLSLKAVPAGPGFYRLRVRGADLFLGSTANLRTQIERYMGVLPFENPPTSLEPLNQLRVAQVEVAPSRTPPGDDRSVIAKLLQTHPTALNAYYVVRGAA